MSRRVELPRWLVELEGMLGSVLGLHSNNEHARAARATALLVHELRQFDPRGTTPRSREALLECLQALSVEELDMIRRRTLYYATHDLVALLAYRTIRRNPIAREEAVLYVHDRLQRDDFRRIGSFDPGHGASYKTYIWQVVSRLLIDFTRSRAFERTEATSHAELASTATDAEEQLSDAQMREIGVALFASSSSELATRSALRDRLRAHVELSSTERLFLKAIFQHGASIDEVRRLPGFEMTSAEAWRYYYRLLERLLSDFKNADALDALRSLLNPSDPRLEVSVADQVAKVEVTRIRYVKQVAENSVSCHVEWSGRLARGMIAESLPRLKKKLAPWFTPVNATALVADELLREMGDVWQREEMRSIEIPGTGEILPVGRTQWEVLRKRYAPKNSAGDSYMNHDTDAKDAAGSTHE